MANDALRHDWCRLADRGWAWLNPPYSKPNLPAFMGKARAEALQGLALVALVPATPGAKWFRENLFKGHDVIGGDMIPENHNGPHLAGWELDLMGNGYRVKVRFLSKRPHFLLNGKRSKEASGMRDSALVRFWPRRLW